MAVTSGTASWNFLKPLLQIEKPCEPTQSARKRGRLFQQSWKLNFPWLEVHETNWTAVATWRWVANDENCGICRMAFDGCCPDCKLPGDDCPLVWGQCSHCFHIHCIVKWLNSQQVHQLCPMCRQEWKFKE